MKDTNIISLIVAPKEVDEKPASLDDTVDNGDDPLLASGQRMSEALAEGNKVIIKKRSGQYPHNTMGGSPQIGRRVTIRIKRPTSPMTGRDKRTSYDNAVENSKEFDYIAAVGTVFEGEKGLEYNLDDMVRVDPLDIRDFVKDHRGSKVIATVPSQAVFPRYVKIPPVSKDKIIQIVRYEAEQNVPFPIEEVLWGYKLIDNGGEDRLDGLGLMLAAAKKDNILPFFEGLRLQGVAEPNDAIGHLYKQRITPDDKDVIVLTTDERATTFTVVNYEGTRFSRSIPIPGYLDEKSNKETIAQSLNGDERQALYDIELNSPEAKPLLESANKNAATRLYAEINRSINFARSQQGADPTKVWIPHQQMADNLKPKFNNGGGYAYPIEVQSAYDNFHTEVDDLDESGRELLAAAALMSFPNGIDIMQSDPKAYGKGLGQVMMRGLGHTMYGAGRVLAFPGKVLSFLPDKLAELGDTYRR